MGKEVIIPLEAKARMSFDVLGTPKSYQDNPALKARWSLVWLIPVGTDAKKAIDAAIREVAVEAWKNKADMILEQIKVNSQKMAWQDGKFKADQYEGYEGCWALSTHRQADRGAPIVMDSDGQPVYDLQRNFYPGKAGRLYAGCQVRGKVEVYAYQKPSPGIAASFSVVQRVGGGDAFGGGKPPSAEEFGAIEEGAGAADLAPAGDDDMS